MLHKKKLAAHTFEMATTVYSYNTSTARQVLLLKVANINFTPVIREIVVLTPIWHILITAQKSEVYSH